MHARRTLLRIDTTEAADPSRNVRGSADRSGAKIKHPNRIVSINCDPPRHSETAARERRTGIGLSMFPLEQRDRRIFCSTNL